MAIVKLQKVAIVGMLEYKDRVFKMLQDAGCVQIDNSTDGRFVQTDVSVKIDETLRRLEWAMGVLEPYSKKRGILEGPIEMNEKKAKSLTESIDYLTLVDNLEALKTKEAEIKQDLNLISGAKITLEPWKFAKLMPREKMESEFYKFAYISGTIAYIECVKRQMAEHTSRFDLQIVHYDKLEAFATFSFHKNDEAFVKSLLSKFQIKEHVLPSVRTTVAEAIENINAQIREEQIELSNITEEMKKIGAYAESFQIIYDFLKWQNELEKVKTDCKEGYITFSLTGWIPASKLNELALDFKGFSNNRVSVVPIETDEDSPVELKNNKWIEPFETVTKLYGLPIAKEIDPTAALATFFALYFGLALTDAGYGIIMCVLIFAVLKFVKMSDDMKKMMKVLMYGGIFTIVMGVLYGGWFGMDASQAPAFLTTMSEEGVKSFKGQILNPMIDPISVLAVSLALGYLQVSVGVFIAFYWEFKHGSKKDALLSNGLWFYSLVMLAIFIAGSAGFVPDAVLTFGKNGLYLGLIALVLTQGRDKKNLFMKLFSGILSLYNFVAYFGDVLSYSRLLALGLATSIVGMAANIVAGLVSDIPYVGWIAMVIILVASHIFNLIINALGAFIHSARLQYVEFFTKFLQGGGRPFTPFKREGKFVLVKDYSNNTN